jgi:hypothetical protein
MEAFRGFGASRGPPAANRRVGASEGRLGAILAEGEIFLREPGKCRSCPRGGWGGVISRFARGQYANGHGVNILAKCLK